MTIFALDPDDPLSEPPAVADKKPRRQPIPRSEEPFTKIELSEITTRRADVIFPPLARLYLYIKIRTGAGRRQIALTNDAVLDLRLSRWQKYKLLQRLEAADLVLVDRQPGEAPMVSLLDHSPQTVVQEEGG